MRARGRPDRASDRPWRCLIEGYAERRVWLWFPASLPARTLVLTFIGRSALGDPPHPRL